MLLQMDRELQRRGHIKLHNQVVFVSGQPIGAPTRALGPIFGLVRVHRSLRQFGQNSGFWGFVLSFRFQATWGIQSDCFGKSEGALWLKIVEKTAKTLRKIAG